MAAVELLPPTRSHINDFLRGDRLSTKFHELFDSKEEVQKKKNEKKKSKKKPKPKKDKKQKRDKSPEIAEVVLPIVELAGNPSSFNVYAHVRQTVLEQCMKDAAKVYQKATSIQVSDTDTEEEQEDKGREPSIKIPKIVGIGLTGVFELIRETCHTFPELCGKALQALLDMLQGQQPESMKAEPTDIVDSLYSLLIDIARGQSADLPQGTQGRQLCALSCAALLSLVIARGDTGKLLTAVAAMLMSPTALATQEMQVPHIVMSLQRSIQAVLLGKTQLPDWLSCGVKEKALRDTFALKHVETASSPSCAIASDGRYLYIHNKLGLYKIGTGFGGTVKGHVYARKTEFCGDARSWLAFAAGKIYFKDLSQCDGKLSVICPDSLEVLATVTIEGGVSVSNVLFSDGEHIGQVAAAKDDSFVVRTYSTEVNPMTVTSEVPLKLARKCLDTFGASPIDDQVDIHAINTGSEEDINSIAAGKEFALIKTASGKVLYTGKSQSLGIKQGGPAQGKWVELSITKSPKISQIAVGHDGQHALLVADDGAVFFVGTPKRGEDGDSSVLKARRQPKPLKPKKMIKVETKFIVYAACNNGTSAVVSKDGEVFMYGKDTSHCDHASGQVTDLKDIAVTQVALGKAHAVALSSKGHVYTFGINNKGQCGRDYNPGASREAANTMVNMVDEEEENEAEDMLCPPGKHKWKTNQCMVCTVCGECTGYGSRCINSGSSERNPGLPCLCGAGDSGCSECGCCKNCAGEQVEDRELIDQLYKSKDLNFLDLVLSGRPGAQQLDQLSKKLEQRKKTPRFKVFFNSIRPTKSNRVSEAAEAEPEYSKLTSLSPAEVPVESGDVAVTQIACGLHHTVLLLQDGSVYSFGSNQYGQLGLGDTTVRGVPTRVPLFSQAVQIAAGSHHTVILLANGQVLTCGNFQKGSLGRSGQDEGASNSGAREKKDTRFSFPGVVPCVGAMFGRRATWIGASGDQTFLRVDESLINAHTLAKSNVFANQACIGLIPTGEEGGYSIRCLVINKQDGGCKSFSGTDQVDLANHATCLDPAYDVLWSYCPGSQEVRCYNVISSEAANLKTIDATYSDIFCPELAVPLRHGSQATRSHCALHVLACMDTHTTTQLLNMAVYEEEREKQTTAKVFSKEDFLVVNRFESHGGGWGYSGHSIEAIRFMADTDVLIGGFGLFGGRGEYYGRIKIFELGLEGGENEADGEVLAETEEMPYECGAREKYAMLFDEPVLLQANTWYVAWARISGPSSDCGSSGQSTVTTDDQVVFKFKSSKKSNNGTDVNAGQIPQILYRLPTHDSPSGVRKTDQVEPAHILSPDFSRTVSTTCFESLLRLLGWSWKTFCAGVAGVAELRGVDRMAGIADLERLVYISTATLRLLRIYITEVYPAGGLPSKAPVETVKLAECVGNTRDLLREILSEGSTRVDSQRGATSDPASAPPHSRLQEEVLAECHRTFTACFHAFYPTDSLKWICLCELISLMEPGLSNMDGYGRLLAAIMEAMCHPSVKLTNIFPINCEHETEEFLRRQSVSIDDNTNSAARLGDSHLYPILVSHMMYRTGSDTSVAAHCSFKEILDRLLTIVTLPIRQELMRECPIYPSLLVANTCSLLATIVSELSSAALGSECDSLTTARPLLTTPNRFTRTSQSAYWNTGNGSPDSVAFSIDRPGVVIAGVCVYGGGGQYDYELELLDESEGHGDTSHSQRWNSLELAKGSYGVDSHNDVTEIKFDRPVPIKENTKYAIRLRNHGPRTLNGDGGMNKVKCPDGTTFTFSACSLSINGTNHTRGQIPQILYYSAPGDGENHIQNSKAMAEQQSRKNAINIASSICRTAKDLLHRAQAHLSEDIGGIVGKSHLFSSLLPLALAYIGPVAAQDSRGAVQVLALVQDVLPAVSLMNSQLTPQVVTTTPGPPANANEASQSSDSTTSQHFAIVESEHPYKPATVTNYKVSFPDAVKWVVLEFDPQCGTAQPEDSLQLYVPSVKRLNPLAPKQSTHADRGEGDLSPTYWPILKKFSGLHNWPKQSVILPGNEVVFSLETASDYVKDDKTCFYGFKCSVVGYEWTFGQNEGIQHLEKELSFLGGMCASSLMRQDVSLPPASLEELDEDLDQVEEGAQMVFSAHCNLLSQGFALSHPPSIWQALEGNLPFCWQSNERAFLKDFVSCTPGTSGGRLARWLQPDSYLDPKQCDILYNKDELKCSWPVVISVQTKDQYGHPVNVSNLRVDVKAVPVDQKDSDDSKKVRRLSRPDDGDLTFGGHPPPAIDIPYEVTVKDKKDAFHAISMMKPYENYSFEELRYAAPSLPRPSENMLVRANNDGTYSANWTPGSVGFYNIYVTIDGFEAGEVYKVEVREPPQGMTPPTMGNKKCTQPNKMRRFIGKHSAGLRIRSNPCLQSEQTGVIAPGGIIGFVDEVHNDDGVWVRLNVESIGKWCSNGYTEGWALQYNQHLAKTLLVPVEEPKSIQQIKRDRDPKLPDVIRDNAQPKKGGPGVYHLVRCGPSGHNIRGGPSRKSRPIGMLVLGNTVTATEDLQNSDGTWVKLDSETMVRYCHEFEGEAWSLSRGPDEVVYLEHETDMTTTPEVTKGSPFSMSMFPGAAASPAQKGYDFTTAHHHPTFSVFGPSFEGPLFGRRASTPSNLSAFHHYGWPSMEGPMPPVFPAFGADSSGASGPTFGFSSHAGVSGVNVYHPKISRGSEGSIAPLHRHPHPKAPVRAATVGSYTTPPSEKLFERKDIPPELQGVSVKELVKALGESRANANGPTPVPSPPGTPKKSLSRSSSPKSDMDVSKRISPRPVSPQRSDSPGSKSQRSDSPCGSVSSKSDSPARVIVHRTDSPGRGHQRTDSPGRGNAPPRPERTDKLGKSDRALNANHPAQNKPDRDRPNANYQERIDRIIMNNFDRLVRGDGSPNRLDANQPYYPDVQRKEKPDLPARNSNHLLEANHVGHPEAHMVVAPTVVEVSPFDHDLGGSGNANKVKGRLTREMSFETPPLTPPPVRKDLSGEVSPCSPRTLSPARMSPARGASGGHTPASVRSQSPAGSSHSSSGGDSIKPAFSIGTTGAKEDLSRSPKSGRKDGRGRQLRSKRERASSPSARELTPIGRARSSSLLADRGHNPVKEALSPSVAECLRAVFAAFLWHEGIVHDAMACASFLKFNPNLSKELSKFARLKPEDRERGRMRHPTDSTHNRGKDLKKVENINININESLASLRSADQDRHNNEANDKATGRGLHTSTSDSPISVADSGHKSKGSVKFQEGLPLDIRPEHSLAFVDKESQLPPTLHHLVYFWEELSSAILKVVTQDLIIPSPAVNVKAKKGDKKDREKDKEKKSKKRRDLKPMARGNLFGEAAGAIMFGHLGGGAGGDRETVCELCGGMFPHPVTYHMRQSHPGCGRHACGKGYNSGGNFCGGWAGNCGEGGIGGSSWYLMCDKCRDKYLREKKHSLKEKDRNKKQKKKAVPKQTSMMTTVESHLVLKNNAMFLLELASAAGISLPVQSHKKRQGVPRSEALLPSVSEDGASEVNPFPPTPFQYLSLRGEESCDTAFADEIFIDQEERVFVRSGSLSSGSPKRPGYRPRLPTEPHGGLARASSLGQDVKPIVRVSPLSPPENSKHHMVETGRPIPKSAGTSPDTDHDQGRRSIFQRSISEIGDNDVMDANMSNRLSMSRRRNNSGGVGDGGTSLLKYPSAAMSKLIGSVDKGGGVSGMGEKALQRPVLAFIIQRHDLDGLQLAMRQSVRKAACRVYAMQALNWLLRVVTHPSSLHDLLWFFVASLLPPGGEEEEVVVDDKDKKEKKDKKDIEDKDIRVCEHPLSDISIAGKAAHPLQPTFHTLLQTIADVMMHLTAGSALQQMAVRCYCLKFRQSDHQFLHESHVFSNISRILTKSDEQAEESMENCWTTGKVTFLRDLTSGAEIKASSRQAMVASLSDNSTETFWESGDEDRNKTKMITISCSQRTHPRMVYVHIDNSRDLGNKVTSVQFLAGTNVDELKKCRQCEIEARHTGWVSSHVPERGCRYLRLELKGPDNNLRLRQVKVLGEQEGESLFLPSHKGALLMQQSNCEAETLKVFRLLTSQVFGKLLFNGMSNSGDEKAHEAPGIDNDLKEHMVGILFSRSKLSHLQKQVCAHIVQAIRKETERVKEEWEAAYANKNKMVDEENRVSDVYCFELLSMVLALSGSGVGRTHLAQQYGLLQDLFTLLHTATPRVQRQVVSVLRRVLPEVQPEILATILKVDSLPPADFSIVTATSREQGDAAFDPDKVGIIDVFLACIAKSLTVQTKVKSSGAHKGVTTVSLADSLSELPSIRLNGVRWWLRGNISGTLTSNIIQLLQDMAAGKLSDPWAAVTKAAIAEAILALTKLDEAQRVPQTCIKTPTLWLALASLCVLDQEHVERLSSGQWVSNQDGQHGQPRPTCDNHDDGVTQAIILCSDCGNLCADCDRFLHLHRKKRSHQRQVFKEEEEAIKVDLHEGCGRTKLFWVMALADSKTLKAMVEFREGKVSNPPGGPGTCRFCGTSSNTGLLAIGNVCADPDCQENARNACSKVHVCGHPCGGIQNEDECLPCLHRCRSSDQEQLKQDADDMCMICFTEALAAAPAIKLQCGHVFHMKCCQKVLENRWVGPRITFGFSLCPICKSSIKHGVLRGLLEPIRVLHEDVRRKALMRLEYEGLHKAEAITTPGARFHSDPAGFAMDRYAYYVCFKCKKAYYGGEVRCDEQAGVGDDYDPQELVCGACSDVSRAQMCPKHGTDFLEYKCRYCCSVAVFFCFGTTHFCNACHDDFQRVTNIPKQELPHCPAGSRGKQMEGEECPLHVQHPPTGEEFALGCGVCRNAHTF